MASGVSTRKLRSGIWRPERERVRTATSELDGEIGILCKEVWDSRQTLDFRRHKAYGGHRTLGIVPGGWQHACAWLGTRKMRSQKNCMGMYVGCSGYNLSHIKSNIMKKAKLEYLNSNEVKIHAAMRRNIVERKSCLTRSAPPSKPTRFLEKSSASTSRISK
ncbi:hypothetical protein HPP92_005702 [Vanilla planifolia]|uniref:Uncharacterized protein n=1 Tax=Vanilla planifolia TaxID=51239 RepID=A0A835VEZ4_VANPL|nr:hypothetical protein HPP92_005702 [Vanilla planifolia]